MSTTVSKITDPRLLCDIELILNGAFAPLDGFMSQKDYNSVVNDCRLQCGAVWPMPIVFSISSSEEAAYVPGSVVRLKDPTGLDLADFFIEDVYEPDLDVECARVLGTTDANHPYHATVHARGSSTRYVGGKLKTIHLPFHFDFRKHRKTPMQVKQEIQEKGLTKVVGFQTRNPMHKCHYELVKYAMSQVGDYKTDPTIGCLVHPVVGVTQKCDIAYGARVRCYVKIMRHFPAGQSMLGLLPLSMRMAGPREALMHAIVRRNYGCTHFVIGRDHAGPSYKDAKGDPFYGPYDAHALVSKYQDEIGITIILAKMIVYVNELNTYLPIDQLDESHTTKHISGTQQRALLAAGKNIPEWFSFPEVVEELKSMHKPNNRRGFCIYVVGISGSGKSVMAQALNDKLSEVLHGRTVTVLDGDIIRNSLSKGLGFSRQDKSANIRRIGFVACEVVKHGGVCICSNIAPYMEDRMHNKREIEQHGAYLEVHVDTPIEVCENRDCKGLYKRARAGVVDNFTGISEDFERTPPSADYSIVVSSATEVDIDTNVCKVLDKLAAWSYI